jgi:hypothetical protein
MTITIMASLNRSNDYVLPEFRDDENNPIIITLMPKYINEFVKVDEDSLIIYPKDWKYLGSHTINLTLSDSINTTSKTFILVITNTAP